MNHWPMPPLESPIISEMPPSSWLLAVTSVLASCKQFVAAIEAARGAG